MTIAKRAGLVLSATLGIVLGIGHWHALHSAPAGVIRTVDVPEKVVALTYDDGPHPTFTPEILRILDKYGVKATFFIVGSRAEQYPQILKDIVAKGHAIGNHTYSHPANLELETRDQVINELIKCEQVLWRIAGKRTNLFRPPKGLVNESVVKTAAEGGYKTVLWTVSAYHHDARTPEEMAKRVLSQVKPGCIILAHDGIYPMRWRDVAATPLIIEELRRQGYRFVTVPELLQMQRTAPTELPAVSKSKDRKVKEVEARPARKSNPRVPAASGG